MRIGIGGWILAWGPSGVTRRLEALTEAAALAGAEVTFFAPPGIEPPPGVGAAGVEVARLPIGPGSTRERARWERRLLPGAVREHRLDLLHLPHAPAPRLPLPLSVTVHDLRDFTRHARPGRRLAAPLLWRAALRRSDILLAVSEFTASEVRRHLPRLAPRIRVVPTGLPERFFRPAGCRSLFPPGAILVTGRPLPHKNPERALQAYGLLRRRRPGAPPLLWVGETADPRGLDLAALARRQGVAEQVILAGPAREEEMPAIYGQAKMALFPSLYEGQGLGPLEAMAGGVPVLASAIPAHREAAGPGCELFDPADPAALAARMEDLLADGGKAERLAARGRAQARRWTTAMMAERLKQAWPGLEG